MNISKFNDLAFGIGRFERLIVDAQRQLKEVKGTWLDVSPHDSEPGIWMKFQFFVLCHGLFRNVSNIYNIHIVICAYTAL